MALSNETLTWFNGEWATGNLPILGAADHATWLGTLVFDGARAFDGVVPDLPLHCARLTRSARAMGYEPSRTSEEIETLTREGLRKFAPGTAVYVRPMMWSTLGSPSMIDPDPESCAFAICLEAYPFKDMKRLSLTFSPFKRPHPDMAPTEAKAACLYPNNGRLVAEAKSRGFDNALSLDHEGNVAETSSTNVFMRRGSTVFTPAPNGTFLNGITRQRTIALLHAEGIEVIEASLSPDDFRAADEIFLTGNASKIISVTKLDDKTFTENTTARLAWDLYMDYARSQPI